MTEILPTREQTTRSSVKLPDRLWQRLEEIAEERDYKRDDVIFHFLSWAIQEWERGHPRKQKK